MVEQREVLRRAMEDAGANQTQLARLSGVRQPTISQVLGGKVGLSDEQLDRLLACLGFQLRIERTAAKPALTRSEQRSWRLHRQLAIHLSPRTLDDWLPRLESNLRRLRSGVRGQPHVGNLDEWNSLISERNILGLHRILTGLDRHSLDMREVSPFSGLLPEDERIRVLQEMSDAS